MTAPASEATSSSLISRFSSESFLGGVSNKQPPHEISISSPIPRVHQAGRNAQQNAVDRATVVRRMRKEGAIWRNGHSMSISHSPTVQALQKRPKYFPRTCPVNSSMSAFPSTSCLGKVARYASNCLSGSAQSQGVFAGLQTIAGESVLSEEGPSHARMRRALTAFLPRKHDSRHQEVMTAQAAKVAAAVNTAVARLKEINRIELEPIARFLTLSALDSLLFNHRLAPNTRNREAPPDFTTTKWVGESIDEIFGTAASPEAVSVLQNLQDHHRNAQGVLRNHPHFRKAIQHADNLRKRLVESMKKLWAEWEEDQKTDKNSFFEQTVIDHLTEARCLEEVASSESTTDTSDYIKDLYTNWTQVKDSYQFTSSPLQLEMRRFQQKQESFQNFLMWELSAQFAEIVIAGHDTGRHVLFYSLMHALKNPDLLKKIRCEISEVTSKPTYKEGDQLVPYEFKAREEQYPELTKLIEWIVRKYNPVPSTPKIASSDVVVQYESDDANDSTLTIPKGTVVRLILPTETESTGGSSQASPFAEGKHACPGEYYILHAIAEIMARLLQNYEVQFVDTEQNIPPEEMKGTLSPAEPVKVNLIPRQQQDSIE